MRDFKEEGRYFPTLVHDKNEQIGSFQKMKKLHTLPQKTQDLLLSDKIGEFIYGVERRYKLQDEQTEEFSRSVRQYYFREITKELFIHKISQLCRISENEASKLFIAINNIKVSDESKVDKKIIKLPLNKAIKEYPQILKQQITTDRITTKPFLKPLVPNVKNWIMVYEKILGVAAHTMIERGEFVFRSDATRGMNEEERKKLLILFKSRDDNSNLSVNEDEGLIEFEVVNDKQENKQKSVSVDSRLRGNDSMGEVSNIKDKQQEQVQKKSVNAMDSGNVILRNPSSLGYIHSHSEGMEKVVREENVEEITEEVVEIKNPQLRKIAQNADNVLDKIEKKQIDQVKLVEKNDDKATRVNEMNSSSQPIISKRKVSRNDNEEVINQKKKKVDSSLMPKKQLQTEENDTKNKKQTNDVSLQPQEKVKTASSKHNSNVMNEVQSEIAKNRVEMSDKKIDKKKIKDIGNERKQSELGTPIIQKTIQNSNRTILETQQETKDLNSGLQSNKKVVKKQGNIAGEISFSSNHTMPAEKKKPVLKQKKYNAFNMQPLGQKYQDDKEE